MATRQKEMFIPALNAHQENFSGLPESVVANGGSARQANVSNDRELGIQRLEVA